MHCEVVVVVLVNRRFSLYTRSHLSFRLNERRHPFVFGDFESLVLNLIHESRQTGTKSSVSSQRCRKEGVVREKIKVKLLLLVSALRLSVPNPSSKVNPGCPGYSGGGCVSFSRAIWGVAFPAWLPRYS